MVLILVLCCNNLDKMFLLVPFSFFLAGGGRSGGGAVLSCNVVQLPDLQHKYLHSFFPLFSGYLSPWSNNAIIMLVMHCSVLLFHPIQTIQLLFLAQCLAKVG